MRQELEALAAEQLAKNCHRLCGASPGLLFMAPAKQARPYMHPHTQQLLDKGSEAFSRYVIDTHTCFRSSLCICSDMMAIELRAVPYNFILRPCADAVLELPRMAELTKAGQPSLKKAIYSLGGRRAVAQQYNFDCKL